MPLLNPELQSQPKTVDLLHAKEHFETLLEALRRSVLQSDGDTWLPPGWVNDSGDTPVAAICHRWTDIYKNGNAIPVHVTTGLLCGSPELVKSALALNDAKESLKQLIVALRDLLKPNELRDMLRTVGMAQHDLTKTYQRVTVLPHPIQAISWTWAVGHQKIEPITVRELRKRAMEQNDGVRDSILADLEPYADTTELARVKTRDLQLRANIQEILKGVMHPKQIVTPGPLLLNQSVLPTSIIWQPEPARDEQGRLLVPRRKTRSDQVLSTSPACAIDGVGYFAYLQKPKTAKRKVSDPLMKDA